MLYLYPAELDINETMDAPTILAFVWSWMRIVDLTHYDKYDDFDSHIKLIITILIVECDELNNAFKQCGKTCKVINYENSIINLTQFSIVGLNIFNGSNNKHKLLRHGYLYKV